MTGAASGIHTLCVNGRLITDKDEIDAALATYWCGVFTKKPLPTSGKDSLELWLKQVGTEIAIPETHNPGKLMESILKHLGNSAALRDRP